MQIRSVGIDLGKTSFHLVALGDNGKVLLKEEVHSEAANHVHGEPADVADWMEACSGAHFLARALRAQGHDAQTDSSAVREAFCEVEQEQLPLMPRRLPKRSIGTTCGSFRSRPMISSTCRRCTGCGIG